MLFVLSVKLLTSYLPGKLNGVREKNDLKQHLKSR